MRVIWEHPKQVGTITVLPGQPFEMSDDEALARLAAGEIGLAPHDAEEHVRLLAARQEPAPASDQAEPSQETPVETEAVSGAPRARRRAPASDASGETPAPESEG